MRLRALLVAAAVGLRAAVAWAEPPPAPPAVIPVPATPRAEETPTVPEIEPPADLSGLQGEPVGRVVTVLDGNVWADVAPPAVTALKVGDVLTVPAARRALAEALSSGAFARGRVAAHDEGGKAVVTLHLVARKLIDHIQIDLHGAGLDHEELLREADLAEGGEIVGADVDGAVARIRRYFAVRGYPEAQATVETRITDDPARAVVLIDAEPGPPRLVKDRAFYVVDAEPEPVQRVARSYAVGSGDRADEPVIDRADLGLEEALHAKGWWKARVSHDMVWVGDPQKGVRLVLRVRIDGGPRSVPHFEGNDHYDSDVLTAALGLDTEPDHSPARLADKIRAFYQKRGFLDVETAVETRHATPDSAVGPNSALGQGARVELVVFHIVEHARVRVTGRSYPCLREQVIKSLSAGGPTSPGGIGSEIDSFLEEDLPGSDLLVNPDPRGVPTVGTQGQVTSTTLPVPMDLRPDDTYVADTYEKAIAHVQELYRSEGFLHAQVGPLQILRARCDPRSPPGRCNPIPLPPRPPQTCAYDPQGLPLPAEPLDPSLTCHPDPAHGVECAPEVEIVIPVMLGPRTTLWDVAFTGVRSLSEKEVAAAAQVPLGEPASTTKLDDARRRVVDWYRELGYYYVSVKASLEPSADNSRARVRFDVNEGEQVIVRAIAIHGLDVTRESIVRRRVALTVGKPYSTSDVRKTQERMATLGVFSNISVGLNDPYVPQANKTVIIDVVERSPQYIEVRPGLSTGEGFRGALEYGHRNLLGYAWSVTLHLQASYLPDPLILDPGVQQNFRRLSTADRIATRDTLTFAWPEMGLGPTIRSQLDAIYVRDLERDFTMAKEALVGTLYWRPSREYQLSGGADYERNDVHVFANNDPTAINGESITDYLNMLAKMGNSNTDLARLLRVPDGQSNAFAERVVFTWDRRDMPFNAHSGTYLALGVEHVDSYPVPGTSPDPAAQSVSHVLRLTETLAGYVPLTSTIALALELRLGEILNVQPCQFPYAPANATLPTYCTYPDREFYMGGFDSMRGWLQDTFIPEDYNEQITSGVATGKVTCANQSDCQVPLRGGNFMFNPRLELRFPLPVHLPIGGAIFGDLGNLWNDPNYIFSKDPGASAPHGFPVRADVGVGVRVDTPVGPLVFDYGLNVTRRFYEDIGAFHFAIGLF
jgi:outer membrane protein assembly factor BamA